MIGFAIGNGFSRVGYNLESLRGDNRLIVGCNYLYRDFTPDIIVAIDYGISREIRKMKDRGFKWLTRNFPETALVLDGEHAMNVLEINRHSGKNSGIIACSYLAKKARCEKVYMVGFDFFRYQPGDKTNDIYADYISKFTNFDKAFMLLSRDCPNTEFIRVGPIPEWDKEYFDGMKDWFTFISYEEFNERNQTNSL